MARIERRQLSLALCPSIPLGQELPQEVFQELVALAGDPPRGLGVHPILQQEELLEKVVER
jgi:hypothetical protein